MVKCKKNIYIYIYIYSNYDCIYSKLYLVFNILIKLLKLYSLECSNCLFMGLTNAGATLLQIKPETEAGHWNKSSVSRGCEVIMDMLMRQLLPFYWCTERLWITVMVKYSSCQNVSAAVSTIQMPVRTNLPKSHHYRYRLWCDEPVIHRCKHWHGNLFREPSVKDWLQTIKGS